MELKFYYLHLAVVLVFIISFRPAIKGSYRENIYNIYYLANNCSPVYELGSNMMSTLKLIAFDSTNSTEETVYCNFIVQPPPEHGIIIHFEEFHLDPAVKNICHNAYLEILNDTTNQGKKCGRKLEGSSIYFEDEASFYFFAEKSFATHKNFTLVATAFQKNCNYTPSTFSCTNGKCIWEGLMIDGVNNCGDNSDETSVKDCDKADDHFAVAIPYIAVFIVLIVCAVGIFAFIQKRKASRQNLPPIRMSDLK